MPVSGPQVLSTPSGMAASRFAMMMIQKDGQQASPNTGPSAPMKNVTGVICGANHKAVPSRGLAGAPGRLSPRPRARPAIPRCGGRCPPRSWWGEARPRCELEGPPSAGLPWGSQEQSRAGALAAEAVGEVELVGDEEDPDDGLQQRADDLAANL
jgi:hypothetical protein